MFIPPYDSSSDGRTKAGLLTVFVNECIPRDDKEQSTRLQEPTLLVFLDDPIPGKNNLKMKNQPALINNSLILFFVSEANRQHGQNMPNIHPNVVRLPHPSSNDDNRCA